MGEASAMVLDDAGEVLFCNTAAASAFASAPEDLIGKHINEFVADSRFSRMSPGSNVAFAAYTGRRNQWREYCVIDGSGETSAIELLFDVVVVDLRYLIMLWARMPARIPS